MEKMTKEELDEIIKLNRESPCQIDHTFADLWESLRDGNEPSINDKSGGKQI